jgi:hypothetical protein
MRAAVLERAHDSPFGTRPWREDLIDGSGMK